MVKMIRNQALIPHNSAMGSLWMLCGQFAGRALEQHRHAGPAHDLIGNAAQ
jgi:hypothetical protein